MMVSSASKQWASRDRYSRFSASRIYFEDEEVFAVATYEDSNDEIYVYYCPSHPHL